MIYFIGGDLLFEDTLFQRVGMEVLLKWLEGKKSIAVDTETEGFLNFKNKVIMLQIGNTEDQFVIDTRCTDVSPLKSYIESRQVEKLLWNAKFDISMLRFTFGWEMVSVYDGFLAECVLTTGLIAPDRTLEAAARNYCNVKLDKEERSKFVGLKGSQYTGKQIRYGSEDVAHLHTIQKLQLIKIHEYDLYKTLYLENKFVEVLAAVEYAGFKLDVDKWRKLCNSNHDLYLKSLKALDEYVLSNPKLAKFKDNQLDLFSDEVATVVEWSSPSQVTIVMNTLGIDTKVPDKRSGAIKDSVDARHLSKFKKADPIVPLYLAYKENEKLVNTYGENFLDNINPVTSRIHSNMWQVLQTGRVSSSDPNLQNIPNDDATRACFVAEEGNLLTIADYSA